MKKRLLAYIAVFTIFACCVFVSYNPNIASDLSTDYVDGEVFTPVNGRFDFGDFTLNCTSAENFTVKIKKPGHIQFIDDKATS